ncbi:efflux RND transporter periplasmic adaptor subunit [Parahaliea mediterranea]|uniref:efflux RND transporter periplasmic adaptor subunit n=1 Tax=Parahaliea mediterranea TaxID=651086 RepID=UPI000E2F425C|nr:efflux RND transporter periplasmic adaptor subunit [Parahaliea mediterranea]
MRILAALLVAGALAAGVWLWPGQAQAPDGPAAGPAPVPVSVYRVEPLPFREEISALGTLRAWESVDITASVSQIVTAIGFEDGQQVEQGDMLALLKQDEEQALLRELEASQQDARREVRRLENLAKRNQVAQNELDKARTQVEILRHQIEEAEARVLDRTILAPFAGTLGLRQVSPGALLTPGQRITTLDDLSRMRLDFTLPALQLGALSVGQPVRATTAAFADTFTGDVLAIDSRVDPVARSITARAQIDNPERRLRPGQLMEVTLLGPEHQALLVPEEALQSRALTHYLWKVVDGERAERVEVTIGGRRPGWVEIRAGIAAGDTVVRDGVGKLGGDSATVALQES